MRPPIHVSEGFLRKQKKRASLVHTAPVDEDVCAKTSTEPAGERGRGHETRIFLGLCLGGSVSIEKRGECSPKGENVAISRLFVAH